MRVANECFHMRSSETRHLLWKLKKFSEDRGKKGTVESPVGVSNPGFEAVLVLLATLLQLNETGLHCRHPSILVDSHCLGFSLLSANTSLDDSKGLDQVITILAERRDLFALFFELVQTGFYEIQPLQDTPELFLEFKLMVCG